MKRFLLISALLFISLVSLSSQENLSFVEWEVDYAIPRYSSDFTGNQYIGYSVEHPSVMTFVNNDGSITVCASDDAGAKTHIYEYDINLKEQKRLSFENERGRIGAFTKDNEGSYYFFYGMRAANTRAGNMALLKYDKDGNKLYTHNINANTSHSFGGIRIPFDAGTCRMELSGSMLAVYFAREMFNGHQACYGFIVDKDTFERIDRGQVSNRGYALSGNNLIPYVSHSFNQLILPIENGFIFADHGDGYPRAFSFAKFQDGSVTKDKAAFRFPGGIGANPTYAEMGALVKTSSGFMLAGAYGTNQNGARNIFLMNIDENIDSCSEPVYLTNYTKDDCHAGHPKIAAIGNGNYVLLWERFSFSTQSANIVSGSQTGYLSTCMLMVNEKGEPVSEIRELSSPNTSALYSTRNSRGAETGIILELGVARLNMSDTLRYNSHTGKVYWATNNTDNSIVLFALDPYKN